MVDYQTGSVVLLRWFYHHTLKELIRVSLHDPGSDRSGLEMVRPMNSINYFEAFQQ